MVKHTFLDKCCTILKDSDLNTGLNPVAELNYGKGVTRALIHFNIDELKEIEKEYGIECNHEDVIMSPVSGCHNGPWLAGYCYFPIRRDDEPLE